MKKKITVFTLSAMHFALCLSAHAQQAQKIPRIGYLATAGSAPSQALLQGLRDLGYVEGKSIVIEYRSAEGKRDRLANLAAELVRLKVDILVTDGVLYALMVSLASRESEARSSKILSSTSPWTYFARTILNTLRRNRIRTAREALHGAKRPSSRTPESKKTRGTAGGVTPCHRGA